MLQVTQQFRNSQQIQSNFFDAGDTLPNGSSWSTNGRRCPTISFLLDEKFKFLSLRPSNAKVDYKLGLDDAISAPFKVLGLDPDAVKVEIKVTSVQTDDAGVASVASAVFNIDIGDEITWVPDESHSNSINVAEPFTGNWAEPFDVDLTSILTGYFDVEVKVTDLQVMRSRPRVIQINLKLTFPPIPMSQ